MSNQKRFDVYAVILDLSRIERIFKNTTPTEKEIFLSNFNKWANQRTHTLHQMEKLKTELNDICRNAKIGRCVGTGVSIVAGLATLVGLGLQLSQETRSIGKELAGLGIGAGLLGGATSVGSSGVEYMVNKRLLIEVKSSLEKDQQLTRQLVPFLEKSADLNSLFRQVFDCDIHSATVKDIFTVVRGVVSLYRQGMHAYEEISEAFSSSVNEFSYSFELENVKRSFQGLSKKGQFLLREFCENRKVRYAILKIENAITSSAIIFDISKVSAKVFLQMFAISKEPGYLSLISIVNSAVKCASVLSKTVTLAIDIVAFIALVKDIPDSESNYCEMVENIESFLSRELSEAKLLVNQYNRSQF